MTCKKTSKKWADFADLPDYSRRDFDMDEKNKEDAFYTNLEFNCCWYAWIDWCKPRVSDQQLKDKLV